MGRPSDPRECNHDGCEVRIILARREFTGRWAAYEAQDRPAFTQEAIGCHVLLSGQAWRPMDLIEHFMATFETTESTARDVVAGYPFHRPHHHHTEEPTR